MRAQLAEDVESEEKKRAQFVVNSDEVEITIRLLEIALHSLVPYTWIDQV